MKNNLFLTVLAALCMLSLGACKEDGPKVESITLNETSVALSPGETFQLTVTVSPEDAAYDAVEWVSSNEAAATVADGVVTAVAEGKAVITASVGNVTASCVVNVGPVLPESVVLDKSTLSLKVGEISQLTATVEPEGAKYELEWSSSDPSVATVDAEGKVTGVYYGNAVITVKAGEVSAECQVTVAKVPVESVEIDKDEAEVVLGSSIKLNAVVNPSDATDVVLVWSSEDESVATVDNNGNVRGARLGTTKIFAEAGGKKDECVVTVVPVPVESVELNKEDAELIVGETLQLTAVVYPTDATDKTLSWSSSDDKVATVVDGLVTAVAEGTADITVTCGDKSDVCHITVNIVPVESITLSATSATLKEGDVYELTAVVNPSNATYKDVEWTSGNEAVATVDASGTVTAISEGTAVIRASSGSVYAECTVTVQAVGQIKTDWELYERFDVSGYGKGIVVEVGTNYIKVLSSEMATLQWAIDPEVMTDYYGTKDDKDGRDGTAALKDADKRSPGNFPAYSWCVALGSGWYMPSLGELEDIMGTSQKRTSINNAMAAAGFAASVGFSEKVWSNSESEFSPESDAYLYNCARNKADSDYKDSEHTVFAILRIDFE